ncbi:MAG: PAS domain S-box protein [Terriglobales bacterium]
MFYGTERAHGREWTAHLVQQLIIFGTIGFVAALLWVIARELDRRDEMADQSSYGLRESEQRYRQQFENNPQPMWVFSVASLRFLAVNDSAVREFGYTRAEFLARTVLDMHPQEDYERVCSVVGSGQPCKGWLWRYRTRSGEWMEAEVFAQPIVWHGEPAFLSFLNDVTARRRAEGRVREQEEQVRLLLESTSEGIFALDLDGRFVWCNPAAAAHLGLRCSGELSGKLMHPLAHHTRADGKLYPEEECSLLGALHAGQPVSLDEELMWRVDGTSFPADVRASPLYREGKLVGAVVTLADATERRNLRAQFQEAQKMEVVGRLAAGVAHDFNNLLTVINGYMELLLEQGGARLSGGRRRRALESVRQAGERAAWLTKQLLAFSRRQVVEPKLLDLGRVLEEMMPLLRQVLREDIDLVCVCEPGLGTVRVDSGQIGQILMNLVVNARDAMPKGGRISLEAANARLDGGRGMNGGDCAPGEYVQLAVRDAGTGMDAETRSHVFEPFFTTKPVGKGTGLGLASVLGIAKQSGGTVDIESGLGRGTTVRVYLPRVEARQAARTPSRAAAACGGGETILVVEDEDGVRELTCEALRSRGYEALDASGPGRALQLLDGYTGRLDMVITDVVMPEMDGLELARRLAERRRGLPVLFVSGYADLETAKRRELERAAGFIQKPFTPEMLAAKVRAVLDEQQEAAARSV